MEPTKAFNLVKLRGRIATPEKSGFISLTQKYANQFYDLVHTSEHLKSTNNRLTGNISFRDGAFLYVSKSNSDKRTLTEIDMVPVNLNETDTIDYYGNKMPSIDSLIHKKLFMHFTEMKYLIHYHIFLKGAPYTKKETPYGSILEFKEIVKKVSDKDLEFLMINVKNHGSIAMSKRLSDLRNLPWQINK